MSKRSHLPGWILLREQTVHRIGKSLLLGKQLVKKKHKQTKQTYGSNNMSGRSSSFSGNSFEFYYITSKKKKIARQWNGQLFSESYLLWAYDDIHQQKSSNNSGGVGKNKDICQKKKRELLTKSRVRWYEKSSWSLYTHRHHSLLCHHNNRYKFPEKKQKKLVGCWQKKMFDSLHLLFQLGKNKRSIKLSKQEQQQIRTFGHLRFAELPRSHLN